MAGSIGLRMGDPDRPVVGVIGDGSSMYAIQALWSAAHYEIGALLIVMANGRYAVMDGLARQHNAPSAWPAFGSIDIAGIARCLGCRAINVDSHAAAARDLRRGAARRWPRRREPLLVEVAVGS